MELVISTCKREPAYIHQTLATLFLNDPPNDLRLHVMMDGQEDFLTSYPFPRLIKYGHPEDNSQLTNRQRAAANYRRCLLIGTDDLLACEDDIAFVPDFFAKLDHCIKEIEGMLPPGQPFALSLSDNWQPDDTVETFPDKPFIRVRQKIENCALCLTIPLGAVYYSKTFPRHHLRDELFMYGVVAPPVGGAHDIAVNWFFHNHDIPVFNSSPPLVIHMGVQTAIPDHEKG